MDIPLRCLAHGIGWGFLRGESLWVRARHAGQACWQIFPLRAPENAAWHRSLRSPAQAVATLPNITTAQHGAISELVFYLRTLEARCANQERIIHDQFVENEQLMAWNRELSQALHR